MYQSGVSAIVNATGRLPQKKEVYEEFLMKVCRGCRVLHADCRDMSCMRE